MLHFWVSSLDLATAMVYVLLCVWAPVYRAGPLPAVVSPRVGISDIAPIILASQVTDLLIHSCRHLDSVFLLEFSECDKLSSS